MKFIWSTIQGIEVFFFKLLYTHLAWGYDFVACVVSLGHWNAWTAAALEFTSGPAVLELGHGTGHFQLRLNQIGLRTFGIDISRQMGRITRRRIEGNGRHARIGRASTQALPFAAGSWKTIVATFPTPHIFEEASILEIKRTLAHDGLLVILLAAWPAQRNLLARLVGLLWRVTGQVDPGKLDPAHLAGRFEPYGLAINVEWRDFRGDKLLFLLAKKADEKGQK